MSVFRNFGRGDRKEDQSQEQNELPFAASHAAPATTAGKPRPSRATGRTEVYAVRVRDTFKGEVRRAVAEIELERQKTGSQARKVTEGEVMEIMLEALKATRRNGGASGYAVPLADDVWRGASELGRRMQMPAGEVIERLMVKEIAALGLLARAK
ncbi:hypothetical protein [Hyphomicrobium sp.]|jgi:hypothetical protein|uniref:hypothetical protein n=1 Tax=Hyphomicrobium sp. TaxID=82 RepID=UPI003567B29E